MKYLSLFSGIGGFELGIQQAYDSLYNAHGSEKRGIKKNTEGKKGQGLFTTQGKNSSTEKRSTGTSIADKSNQRPLCVGFSEIDKYATQIYQKHFPTHKNYGDITQINVRELPDFELLVGGFPCQSFSIAGQRRGFEDTRGTMFFEIARIVKEKQPRLLVLENVKGLLSHAEGSTFLRIISTLDELGYDIQWQVLNSKNFGVPQNRERVFIVGHLRGTSRPQVFPIGKCNQLSIDSENEEGQGRSIEPRRNLPELTGGRGNPKGLKIRRLTPTECERLQGFPDGWTEGISDTQRYKCCGNAVTVNVVKEVISKLLK